MEDNPERLRFETKSFLSRKESSWEDALPACAPLVNVNGYADSVLMKDNRFKLQMMLQEKGLHQTEAGLQAMMAASTRTAPRPEAFTSKDSILSIKLPGS